MGVNGLPSQAVEAALQFSDRLSDKQVQMLAMFEPADRARMEAQLKLQNYQELVSFLSNMLKKDDDTSKPIVNNLR